MRILKTYENLSNPCSRSIREACQLKPHYTESTRSARPPEWMFNKLRKNLCSENICKSVGNYAYSLKTIKAMEMQHKSYRKPEESYRSYGKRMRDIEPQAPHPGSYSFHSFLQVFCSFWHAVATSRCCKTIEIECKSYRNLWESYKSYKSYKNRTQKL